MTYNNGKARGSRKLAVCALVVIGLLGGLVLIGCGSSGGSNGATPLNVSWELLGDEVTVEVMVASGTTIDEDIMVIVTLTPTGGRAALTETVTVASATGSGMATFTGVAVGSYELAASAAGARVSIAGGTDVAVLLEALALSDTDTDNSVSRMGGASFSLPLVMPARDAYKISLVDTGTPADSATTLGSALAISDPDGADQGSLGSPRLYRDPAGTKTLGATVPTGFTDGLIYAFLPGDDGADAPTRGAQDSDTYYELIWRQNDNTTPVPYPSQLAAAGEYTLTITAENTVSWRLRVELHDLPRLPANIATTFRGPQEGHQPQGLRGPGAGFYLVYNPTSGASSIRLRLERAAAGTGINLFAAGGTIAIRALVGNQDECITFTSPVTQFTFTSVAALLVTPTQIIASIDQPIYCLYFDGGNLPGPIADVGGLGAPNPNNDFGRRSGHFVFTLLSEPVTP